MNKKQNSIPCRILLYLTYLLYHLELLQVFRIEYLVKYILKTNHCYDKNYYALNSIVFKNILKKLKNLKN